MKPAKWTQSTPPGVKTGSGSVWDRWISNELLRVMRLNPGTTYQLLNDDNTPMTFMRVDTAALTQAAPEPYRVITRRAGQDENQRHVWVSCDPAYHEELAKKRAQNKKKKAKK